MQAGRQVGGLAEGELFLARSAPHVADYHQPGMDAQAHGQVHRTLLRQAGIELSEGCDYPKSGPDGPLGVVFVCQGIAKVDEDAIAQILRDMPLKAGDHLGTGVLIGPHHLTQLFWVELAGECRRVHQVTKEHGELAPFRVRQRDGGWGDNLRVRSGKGVLLQRKGGGDGRREHTCASCPDQHPAVFVHRQALALNEFRFHIFQVRVVELELPLEGAIGQAPAALEHGYRLVKDLLKGHRHPSLADAACGRRCSKGTGV